MRNDKISFSDIKNNMVKLQEMRKIASAANDTNVAALDLAETLHKVGLSLYEKGEYELAAELAEITKEAASKCPKCDDWAFRSHKGGVCPAGGEKKPEEEEDSKE